MNPPRTIVAMASGGGRTVLNLIEVLAPRDGVTFDDVFVSQETALAADRCEAAGMRVHRPGPGEDVDVDAAAARFLEDTRPDMVLLCGYLRWLHIPETLKYRVMNIHPSLLPAHGGKGMHGTHVHRSVLDAGDAVSGCSVHLVDEVYDHGPIVLQRTCDVLEGDDHETLAARVFLEECRAYPDAVERALAGGLRLHEGRVESAPTETPWTRPLFWRD